MQVVHITSTFCSVYTKEVCRGIGFACILPFILLYLCDSHWKSFRDTADLFHAYGTIETQQLCNCINIKKNVLRKFNNNATK